MEKEQRIMEPKEQPLVQTQKSVPKGHDIGWTAHCLGKLECASFVRKRQVTSQRGSTSPWRPREGAGNSVWGQGGINCILFHAERCHGRICVLKRSFWPWRGKCAGRNWVRNVETKEETRTWSRRKRTRLSCEREEVRLERKRGMEGLFIQNG